MPSFLSRKSTASKRSRAKTSPSIHSAARLISRSIRRSVEMGWEVTGQIKPKSPGAYTIVGKPVPRVDIPPKATGEHIYVHNFSQRGMLRGRFVRLPAVGAKLVSADEVSIKELHGLLKVVVKANFVGFVCPLEEQ